MQFVLFFDYQTQQVLISFHERLTNLLRRKLKFSDDRKFTNFFFYNFGNKFGELPERSIGAVSKTVVRQPADRGFESPTLRHLNEELPLGCKLKSHIFQYFYIELTCNKID